MKLLRTLVLSTLSVFIFSSGDVEGEQSKRSCCLEDEGYYWRDYDNSIPKDAFPAGKNTRGNTTYIGQILRDNILVPAKIESDPARVTYEWGLQEHVATTNIKILCAQYPEDLKWIPSSNGHIQTLTDENLISGGFETGRGTFIGRIQLDDELAVGKIGVNEEKRTYIFITKNGNALLYEQFQVLANNKQNKDADSPTEADSTCSNNRTLTIQFFV